MIERYQRKEMKEIWSNDNKYKAWLEVELLTCEAFGELGIIPKEDVLKLRKNASYKLDRIAEIEKETKHDVIAFTRAVSETLGEEKKWIHYGLTSTDVVDTANGYLYKQANKIIKDDLNKLIRLLREKALQYKDTPMMGRTHGIHAEITTFGLVLALWVDELNRHLERFQQAAKGVEVGKISGAVGTFANTPPFVQDTVCEKLGIDSARISTQVLQRDRHNHYFSVLSGIGSSLEKMATEIRHLARTEVGEVQEYFEKKQKGSSAMPHKRNPIGSENISGCARLLRGYALSASENVALWHQRDISHSSVERIIAPDATSLLDYMLNRFDSIMNGLVVNEDKMLSNIYLTGGIIFSGQVVLKLIEKGYSREEAYDRIQPLTHKSYQQNIPFKELLERETDLSGEEIEDCFDLKYHLKQVDTIFERVQIK